MRSSRIFPRKNCEAPLATWMHIANARREALCMNDVGAGPFGISSCPSRPIRGFDPEELSLPVARQGHARSLAIPDDPGSFRPVGNPAVQGGG